MKFLATLLTAAVLATVAVPAHAATPAASSLIKASGPAVYYYASNGKRYVFPTEKTYKSWYTDFSGVITVSDAELAALPIGGNVTYRPGTRLVKITTDPKVYAVEGTTLRWVTTEALAVALFGATWAQQVDDIPDAFFTNYTVGASITATSDFSPAAVRDAAPTIQTVVNGSTGAPTEPPTSPEEPEEPTNTPPASNITFTLDKTQAQSNEKVGILVQAPASLGVTRIILSVDSIGTVTECTTFSCSSTWTIPVTNVQTQYTFRARLIYASGTSQEVTKSIEVVSMPVNTLAKITTNRLVLKSTQFPNIRAIVSTELRPSRTDIVINGTAVKTCSTTPTDCPYPEYLLGNIGATYDIYALVITSDALTYKSPTVRLTIAENDAPLISLQSGKGSIFSGETVEIGIAGEDDDGIDRMVISHNGTVLKTCVGPAPCAITTGPWNLPAGSTLTFTGTITDTKGIMSSASTTVAVTQ